jgi:hypothetical protein
MSNETTSVLNIPPAVRKYMQELELQLKQIPGICPEDALADARDFLLADNEALLRSAEPPDSQAHYDWIVSQFGEPSQVARQYSAAAIPSPPSRPGNAPGWRICCTTCGRSAPYASTGAIRIGAFSVHKYIGCWCHRCNKFRWCRVIRDLDKTNLTDLLCTHQTPEQLRKSMHISVLKLVLSILLLVLVIQAIVWCILIFGFRVFE